MSKPIISWGTPDDLTTWSQVGTCTVGSLVLDPFSGTTAYSLDDNDGAAVESRYTEYVAAYTGWHVATVCLRYGSGSGESAVQFENRTLADSGGTALYTWTGSVGVMSVYGGSNVLDSISIGNGWYAQRIKVFARAGDTMRITVYPAGLTASSTNYCGVWVANLTFLDEQDQAVEWRSPRDGSAWAQGASGVEDAWIQGTDFHYQFGAPWVPRFDRDWPVGVSGWNGPYERVGVNTGVQALLDAGRAKEVLTIWEDRQTSIALEGVPCYLVSPMDAPPSLQGNGDRSLTLEFRNASRRFRPIDAA